MKKRLPSWSLWIGTLGLAGLLIWGGIKIYDSWAANRDLENAQAEYANVGESLNYADFTFELPDGVNYATIPALRGITIPPGMAHPTGIDGEQIRSRLISDLFAFDDRDKDRPEQPALTPTGKLVDIVAWAEYSHDLNFTDQTVDPDADASEIASATLILEVLDSEYGDVFSQSDEAVNLPYCQFLPKASDFYDGRGITEEFPFVHLNPLFHLSKAFCLRAISATRLRDTDRAYNSILAILRISDGHAKNELGHVQHFWLSAVQFPLATAALRDSLAAQFFDEVKLASLQEEFASFDVVSALALSLRADVIFIDDTLKTILRGEIPRLDSFSEAQIDRARGEAILATHNHGTAPISFRDFLTYKNSTRNRIYWIFDLGRSLERGDDKSFLRTSLPFYDEDFGRQTARAEALANQAEAACALERHFLKNGSYPVDLGDLVPEFLESVPEDPIDRQPLRYRKTSDGRYLLYSIAWDFVDDGGLPVWQKNGSLRLDLDEGDWLWTYQTLTPTSTPVPVE